MKYTSIRTLSCVLTSLTVPWAACNFPASPRANFYFNESITAAGSNFTWTMSDSKSGACTNLVHHGADIGGGYR